MRETVLIIQDKKKKSFASKIYRSIDEKISKMEISRLSHSGSTEKDDKISISHKLEF